MDRRVLVLYWSKGGNTRKVAETKDKSLGAIASLLVLISGRLAVPTARRLTRPQDVLVLVILLLTFGACRPVTSHAREDERLGAQRDQAVDDRFGNGCYVGDAATATTDGDHLPRFHR